MPNDERGRLDTAIDRAVRRMMQVEPRPGLRHRVVGELGTTARRGFWRLPVLTAAAMGAIVLIALAVQRPQRLQPGAEPPMAVATPAPPASQSVEPREVASAPASPDPLPATRGHAAAIFGAQRGLVTATSVERISSEAGAIPCLNYQPCHTESSPLAPIRITPIQVQPIAITPMTLRNLPDGR